MKTCKVCGGPLSKHDYVSIVEVHIEKVTPGCWAGNEEHYFTVDNVHRLCADAIVEKLRGLLAKTMEGKLMEEDRKDKCSCKFEHKDISKWREPGGFAYPEAYPDKEIDMESYPLGEDV